MSGGVYLSRVQIFREYRKNRRIFAGLLLFFVLLLITGLIVADFSINSLKSSDAGISLLCFIPEDGYLEVSILNRKIFFNTSRLQSDLEKIKQFLRSIL